MRVDDLGLSVWNYVQDYSVKMTETKLRTENSMDTHLVQVRKVEAEELAVYKRSLPLETGQLVVVEEVAVGRVDLVGCSRIAILGLYQPGATCGYHNAARMDVAAAEEAGRHEEAWWVDKPEVVFLGLNRHSLFDIDCWLNTLRVRKACEQHHQRYSM